MGIMAELSPDGAIPPNAVVRLDDAGSRYVVDVDGKPVGFTRFTDRGEHRVFLHTEVDQGYSGQGLAGVLISGALTDVRSRHLRIISLCPFVSGYLRLHHDFDDIVDRPTPAQIAELTAP